MYASRFGPAVLPVSYALHDGAVVFRTAEHGPLDEDLRTGIGGAEYRVAFEIRAVREPGRLGMAGDLGQPQRVRVPDEQPEQPAPFGPVMDPGDALGPITRGLC